MALTITASLMSFAAPAWAQAPPGPHDAYARFIARSDAIVMGRVVDAGNHQIPDPGHPGAYWPQSYARIAVDQWIVGPDTDSVIEVRGRVPQAAVTQGKTSEADTRVIVYLMQTRNEWWIQRELSPIPGHPMVGLEVLPSSEANRRILAIRKEAKASAPAALASRADVIVVGSLERFTENPSGMVCRVERVVSGTLAASELTVVIQTPNDLGLGRALLFLTARPDSAWDLLSDDASCYYLDRDRVAHSKSSLEKVIQQMAAAHANRDGGVEP